MALSRLLDTTPPSLLTTAACGGLRPAPDCRPRRALLHLSYSSAPSYSDGAFVTHAPFPSFSERPAGGASRPLLKHLVQRGKPLGHLRAERCRPVPAG